jgi:hypothetical protein
MPAVVVRLSRVVLPVARPVHCRHSFRDQFVETAGAKELEHGLALSYIRCKYMMHTDGGNQGA